MRRVKNRDIHRLRTGLRTKKGVLMSERRVHGGGCRADQDQVKVKRQQVSPPMMVEVRFMVRRLL